MHTFGMRLVPCLAHLFSHPWLLLILAIGLLQTHLPYPNNHFFYSQEALNLRASQNGTLSPRCRRSFTAKETWKIKTSTAAWKSIVAAYGIQRFCRRRIWVWHEENEIGSKVNWKLNTQTFFHRSIDLVGFPGEIFMNILKALMLPLIASSLVSGLSQMDARQVLFYSFEGSQFFFLQSGRIGLFALIYYSITMALAVFVSHR